jgi:diketogulonate reductase-like aldo/keto reductase
MKAIQIEVDDELLDALAKDEKVQAIGVSEFFRATVKSFLKWKVEREIDKQYERVYSDPRVREEFDREVKEWLEEQVWIE